MIDHRQLDAAGVRWSGSYDVLVEGWSDEIDLGPWQRRQGLRVNAPDAESAKDAVATALRRPDLVDEMDAFEPRSS